MRGRKDLLLALVSDPGFDQIGSEHATSDQKVVVGLESGEGLFKGSGKLRDVLRLLWRQLVQVFVDRLVRFDAVFDPIEAGHQLGGEGQIRVA